MLVVISLKFPLTRCIHLLGVASSLSATKGETSTLLTMFVPGAAEVRVKEGALSFFRPSHNALWVA